MNTKRYKNAKWLSYEEAANMSLHLIYFLFKENSKRSERFEKYVHSRITSMNPVDVAYFKEILLKRLFILSRKQKTSYYRNRIEKHLNKINEFLQDRLGKPHFFITEYYIFNGDSEESGPPWLRQSIIVEDFFKKI